MDIPSRFELSPRDILRPFGFDRFEYASDLCADSATKNAALRARLVQIRDAFDPDVVICPTDNSYLRGVFQDRLVLFYEVGPLPRWDGRSNLYFDVGGVQRRSVLSSGAETIRGLDIPSADLQLALDRWARHQVLGPDFAHIRREFEAWLEPIRRGRSIVILANQKPDHIAIEGAHRAAASGAVMMEMLDQLQPDWLAVATYHWAEPRISPFEEAIGDMFPNLAPLPAALASLGSEPLIPSVDGLATIASKAAMSALVSGKAVAAIGRSMIEAFAVHRTADLVKGQGLDDATRGRLICFLANRYCLTFEQCFETNGYLLNFIETLLAASSPWAAQLDFSDWSVNKLDNLFGPTQSGRPG